MIDPADLYTMEGLVTSGAVDYLWDRGWREPTTVNLQAAQHHWPAYEAPGAQLPKRAVIASFVNFLPDLLEQVKIDGCEDGQYIVVTGPGDQGIGEGGGRHCNVSHWPGFVRHVFGHNLVAATPRATAVPMAFHAFRGSTANLPGALAIPRTPENRVLVSFSLDLGGVTNKDGHERVQAIHYFQDKSWATVPEQLRARRNGCPWEWHEYARRLRSHAFLVCPIGYGIERIAGWEAMALGIIPIMLRHSELLHFADMPIAFVDRWEDVTPGWLDEQEGLIERRSMDKLRLSYWVDRVQEKRRELFA